MKMEISTNLPREPMEAAAYWIMRLESPECGPTDRAAFEAWRAEKPEHANAYARSQQGLAQLDRFLLDPRLIELGEEVYESTQTPPRLWSGSVAAGLAAIGILSILVASIWQSGSQTGLKDPTVAEAIDTYETRIGERSTFSLSDESTITLNTNSRVSVHYTDSSNVRVLKLLRGQAWFEVAKEDRLFEVYAGDHRVVALGTAFDVKLATNEGEVQVTLAEGLVMVEVVADDLDGSDITGSSAVEARKPTRLAPGQQLIAKPKERSIVVDADMDRATGWRDGRLVFRGDSLTQAVAEINRYNERKIVVSDHSQLKDIRVSGVFATGGTRSFLEAIEAIHPVKAKQISYDLVELAFRPGS